MFTHDVITYEYLIILIVHFLFVILFLLFFFFFVVFVYIVLFFFFFFFFQAEDGIRDRDVTGVQTCALPIFRIQCSRPQRRSSAPASRSSSGVLARSRRLVGMTTRSVNGTAAPIMTPPIAQAQADVTSDAASADTKVRPANDACHGAARL